jgi:hypothetical protein
MTRSQMMAPLTEEGMGNSVLDGYHAAGDRVGGDAGVGSSGMIDQNWIQVRS